MLKQGDKAPDFTAEGLEGEATLASLLAEGPVVLYFYPRALTSGCTVEAVEFNELLPEFAGLGIQVVGMSTDPVDKLRRFKDKNTLVFPLLSDADRAVGAAYGTLKGEGTGTHERDTVLIAPDGTILLAYQRVRAAGHAARVLADGKGLREKGLI